jgi:thioredoxin reductase (NADPH)
MSDDLKDVVVVGGGPAGLTAAIYASRLGLETLLIEGKNLGGRALSAPLIDNYPGFPEGISGSELMNRFIRQAERFNVAFKKEVVTGLLLEDGLKMLSSGSSAYQTKSIILCLGIQRKEMKLTGEMQFKGLGVSYCAICDGPLFKDKVVAVLGNGDEAIEEVYRMADIAEKVYAIPGRKGYENKIDEMQRDDKIIVIENSDVEAIGGDAFVKNIKLKEKSEPLPVEGVFIIQDNIPTTELIKNAGIGTNESGCIIVDKDCQTNVGGVYAAGDCTCGGMQVVTATGQGAIAALSAYRFIKSKY